VRVFVPDAVTQFNVGLSMWGTNAWYMGELTLSSDIGTAWINGGGFWHDTGIPFSKGAWNLLEMFHDFETGSLSGRVNGTMAAQSPTFNFALALASVDLSVFGTNGNVYFDAYRVEAVPEPASLAALALGAAVLTRRRLS
jgi:hypothetical protein